VCAEFCYVPYVVVAVVLCEALVLGRLIADIDCWCYAIGYGAFWNGYVGVSLCAAFSRNSEGDDGG